MKTTNTLTTLYVQDLERALPWYHSLFARAFDQAPMPSCREWNTSPGATVQVIANPERAGSCAVALVIQDLEPTLAQLRAQRIEPESLKEIPGFIRYAILRDPDGNEVTLVESQSGS